MTWHAFVILQHAAVMQYIRVLRPYRQVLQSSCAPQQLKYGAGIPARYDPPTNPICRAVSIQHCAHHSKSPGVQLPQAKRIMWRRLLMHSEIARIYLQVTYFVVSCHLRICLLDIY